MWAVWAGNYDDDDEFIFLAWWWNGNWATNGVYDLLLLLLLVNWDVACCCCCCWKVKFKFIAAAKLFNVGLDVITLFKEIDDAVVAKISFMFMDVAEKLLKLWDCPFYFFL